MNPLPKKANTAFQINRRNCQNPQDFSFFFYTFSSSFFEIMASVRKRPLKVVTDSEDDQSDSRQRRDLHITSKRVSTIAEEKEDKKKGYAGFSHTLPIHTITKASVLSKEAPPENYSGFLRLGSKFGGEAG